MIEHRNGWGRAHVCKQNGTGNSVGFWAYALVRSRNRRRSQLAVFPFHPRRLPLLQCRQVIKAERGPPISASADIYSRAAASRTPRPLPFFCFPAFSARFFVSTPLWGVRGNIREEDQVEGGTDKLRPVRLIFHQRKPHRHLPLTRPYFNISIPSFVTSSYDIMERDETPLQSNMECCAMQPTPLQVWP